MMLAATFMAYSLCLLTTGYLLGFLRGARWFGKTVARHLRFAATHVLDDHTASEWAWMARILESPWTAKKSG